MAGLFVRIDCRAIFGMSTKKHGRGSFAVFHGRQNLSVEAVWKTVRVTASLLGGGIYPGRQCDLCRQRRMRTTKVRAPFASVIVLLFSAHGGLAFFAGRQVNHGNP